MPKEHFSTTSAIRVMKEKGISFTLHQYRYEEHGGTEVSARELGVDEHIIIKTLVMEDDRKVPFIILMHGDRHVSTKNMARYLGAKSVQPCDPNIAERHTGYRVGGTSPFGTRKHLKIFIESTILDLPRILINAGQRGLLAEMSPLDMAKALSTEAVNVAID
ncbi:MAG TPA: Cys-tRNA(Pro) deacylase [Desulfomonilia bacterium]